MFSLCIFFTTPKYKYLNLKILKILWKTAAQTSRPTATYGGSGGLRGRGGEGGRHPTTHPPPPHYHCPCLQKTEAQIRHLPPLPPPTPPPHRRPTPPNTWPAQVLVFAICDSFMFWLDRQCSSDAKKSFSDFLPRFLLLLGRKKCRSGFFLRHFKSFSSAWK